MPTLQLTDKKNDKIVIQTELKETSFNPSIKVTSVHSASDKLMIFWESKLKIDICPFNKKTHASHMLKLLGLWL